LWIVPGLVCLVIFLICLSPRNKWCRRAHNDENVYAMCYLLASFEVIGSRVFYGDYFMSTHVALLPKQICRNDRLGGKYSESCKLSMPLHD